MNWIRKNLAVFGNRLMGFDFQGMSDEFKAHQDKLEKNKGLYTDLTSNDFGIELTSYDFIQSFSPILSEDGKKLMEKYSRELDRMEDKVRNYFLELECNSDIYMSNDFYKTFGNLKDEVIKSRMQSYCNRDNCFGYSLMKGERPPKINGDEELEKHLFRIAFMHVLIFSYFVFHREMRELNHPKILEDIVACGVLEFLWYNGYREDFSLAVSLMAKKPLSEQAGLILFFEYPECVKDFRKRARFMTDGESVFSSYKPGEKGSGVKLKQILGI